MLTTLASCPDICSHSAAEHLVWLMMVTLRKSEEMLLMMLLMFNVHSHLVLHGLHLALGELQLLRCVAALFCRTQGPSHLSQ